jgi:hypothetical protein
MKTLRLDGYQQGIVVRALAREIEIAEGQAASWFRDLHSPTFEDMNRGRWPAYMRDALNEMQVCHNLRQKLRCAAPRKRG